MIDYFMSLDTLIRNYMWRELRLPVFYHSNRVADASANEENQ